MLFTAERCSILHNVIYSLKLTIILFLTSSLVFHTHTFIILIPNSCLFWLCQYKYPGFYQSHFCAAKCIAVILNSVLTFLWDFLCLCIASSPLVSRTHIFFSWFHFGTCPSVPFLRKSAWEISNASEAVRLRMLSFYLPFIEGLLASRIPG